MTSLLLATPQVRTCIGCGRKALLAPNLNSAGAEEIADAAAPTEEGAIPLSDAHGARRAPADAAAQVPVPGDHDGDPVRGGADTPATSGSNVVQDLLDATRRCPLCGNNFVVLV